MYASLYHRMTIYVGATQNKTMLSAFCAYCVALSFGYIIGYSSVAIPDMEKNHIITKENAASFGSLLTVGGIIGCPLAGWLMERFGRKKALVFACLPMILGYGMTVFLGSESINLLFLGRLLTGVTGGMSTVVMGIYVAETATKEYRGMLGSGVQLSITIGILIVYILGAFFDWRMLALLGCVFPVLAIFLSTKVPETPRWHLLRGRKAEAVYALQLLRGTMDVEDEIAETLEALPDKNDTFTWADMFKSEVFRPLKAVVILNIFQQTTGINVVMFYTVMIFDNAGFKGSSLTATIIIGIVQVVATTVAVFMVDKTGRRPLIFIGGALIAGSCFTMGLYHHWTANINPVQNLQWLALTSLIVYIIGFSLGWGPIPGLLMSEMFPAKARGTATAISCLCNWGTAYLLTSNALTLMHSCGQDCTFWLFSGATVLGTFLVHIYVPETKGKSLEEIELYFLGRVIHGI